MYGMLQPVCWYIFGRDWDHSIDFTKTLVVVVKNEEEERGKYTYKFSFSPRLEISQVGLEEGKKEWKKESAETKFE